MLGALMSSAVARPAPLVPDQSVVDADFEAATPRAFKTALSALSPSQQRRKSIEHKLTSKTAEIKYYERILAGSEAMELERGRSASASWLEGNQAARRLLNTVPEVFGVSACPALAGQ